MKHEMAIDAILTDWPLPRRTYISAIRCNTNQDGETSPNSATLTRQRKVGKLMLGKTVVF